MKRVPWNNIAEPIHTLNFSIDSVSVTMNRVMNRIQNKVCITGT